MTLWINGGLNGGQLLHVQAVSGNDPINGGVQLPPLVANTWQSKSFKLSDLGVTDTTVLNGFWIQDSQGTTQATFYVDDVSMSALPPPSIVNISVDASNVLRKADARWLGLNTAAWDGSLDSDNTISSLTQIGTRALRWPGGSWGDVYHGMNEGFNTGASGSGWPRTDWGAFTTNFMHVATNIHAQVFMIANYGSSTPQEAANWLRFCNITNHAGFKYWEIGNENYGSWEEDDNTGAPYLPHDPWTYALRFRDYYTLMKSIDPTIKIGAVAVTGEDSYLNNYNHVAINLRTGLPHYGWTPVMLSTLKLLNIVPDFLVYHFYPEYQQDSDTTLLQASRNWAGDAASLRQQLNDYLGPDATNVEIVCTENNADSGSQGRQSTSLVNALYLADSLSKIMRTEFNAYLWWDLRNGIDTGGDFSSGLYGWRSWGDLGIMYGDSVFYPTFYSLKLMQYLAEPDASVLNPTSDYSLLASGATLLNDGGLALLVINKNPSGALTGNVTLKNFVPTAAAMVRSYGIPQDDAARTGIGSPDIATNVFFPGGTSFSYSFPAYSMTLFTFPASFIPDPPQLQPMPSPAGQFVFQLQGQSTVAYTVQRSSNLVNWTSVSTNVLSGSILNITNAIPGGAPRQFWRVLWRQSTEPIPR